MFSYSILCFGENKLYTFDCIAKTFKGKNEVLLDKGDNLLENVNFNDKGYKVVNFKKFLSHKLIIQCVEKYVKNLDISMFKRCSHSGGSS